MYDRPTLRNGWINIVVLLAYFGIALGITWPLVTRITTDFPGGSQDTLFHYWNNWWVEQALTTGQSPYYTPYLHYPTGMSLVYHNFGWVSIVTWLMLKPWMGGLAAYNFSILINLALCGWAAFLLACELINDRRAAFLAGLIYQCWPFRVSELDHPNLIGTQWIPIFMLFLIRTVRQGKWRDAVLTGAFLALTGYTRWQQLIPAAILGGVYLVCTLPSQHIARRRWVLALLLAGVVAALALAPPALMLMEEQRTAPAEVLYGEEETYQTDLLAYLTPSRSHSVLKSLTNPAYCRYYADRYENRRSAAYIGVTALVLAVLGVRKARRASLSWVVMAFVLILLALGPILRINGQPYPAVPMPYRLAARLYVVRLMRVPDRFNMFLALPIAMLSAYGITHILALVQRRGSRAILAAACLLGGAILIEYLTIPLPLLHPRESQFYRRLSTEPGDFAVLNIPVSAEESKQYMFAQTTHQHPIVQGNTSRFPEGAFDYLNNHPWLQTLRLSSTMPPAHTDVSRQLAALAQDDVRYVILHKKSAHPLRLHHWRHYFLIPPRFEDEFIVVYPTAPLAGHDFTLMDELAPGIGLIRFVVPTNCLSPGRILAVDVGWGTTAPPGQNWDAKLALDGGIIHYEQTFPFSAGWSPREWPANVVAWEYYTLSIPPSLPSGAYTVTLALVDPVTDAVADQQALVGRVTVNDSACTLPIPPDAIRVNAVFGDRLHLLGYQLHRDNDRLTLTLHWRSERLMESDYKVFVHVVDPVTELRVAQDDSMPMRWAHPTTYWECGEVVVDDIPLSLENAPVGVYSVIVGVYDSETGHRLPAMDGTGQLQPGAQMVLPGAVIEVEEKGL